MEYMYKELFERATAADATQTDVDNLGKWFSMYGGRYWNGEYYDADGLRLYPVYIETSPDEFKLLKYELN